MEMQVRGKMAALEVAEDKRAVETGHRRTDHPHPPAHPSKHIPSSSVSALQGRDGWQLQTVLQKHPSLPHPTCSFRT